MAGTIGIEGGWEDVGVLTRLCEEELLDIVDEGIAVLAQGDWAKRGWVKGVFFGLGVRMREICLELESMMRQRRES